MVPAELVAGAGLTMLNPNPAVPVVKDQVCCSFRTVVGPGHPPMAVGTWAGFESEQQMRASKYLDTGLESSLREIFRISRISRSNSLSIARCVFFRFCAILG